MDIQRFKTPSAPDQERVALVFGQQKINLHQRHIEVFPVCKRPAEEGTADFCLLTSQPVTEFLQHWKKHNCELATEGVVKRTGAHGPLSSVYVYDPDGNLIEVSNYLLEQ
jgi:catechol 2,3-dioxygenase-like lactoylglutathione lyase family enzyme